MEEMVIESSPLTVFRTGRGAPSPRSMWAAPWPDPC